MQKKITFDKIEYLESRFFKLVFSRIYKNIDILTSISPDDCILDISQSLFEASFNSFKEFEHNKKFLNSCSFQKELDDPGLCCVDNECLLKFNVSLETENIDEIHYDINETIRINKHFNSYRGIIVDDGYNVLGRYCSYLPMVNTKQKQKDGRKGHSREIYLSYCIKLLLDNNHNIHAIIVFCIPNGNLSYLEEGIKFSKENSILGPIAPLHEEDLFFNDTDVLFRYNLFREFKLNEDSDLSNTEQYRIKLLYFNNDLDENCYKNSLFLDKYLEFENENNF